MSHYPRRPRIHPHSRHYDVPIASVGRKPPSFLPFRSSSTTSTNESTERDRTRGPKLMAALFTGIILLGVFYESSTLKPPVVGRSAERAYLKATDGNVTSDGNNNNDAENSGTVQDSNGRHFVYGKVVDIPEELNYMAELTEPHRQSDRPLFWHIPRSGGSTVKHITASCLFLTQASEVGAVGGHIEDDKLMIVEHVEGGRFVNVDTTVEAGLERAIEMNLASLPGVHIIVTPYIMQSGALFDSEHKGRLFTMFRHPIDRAVSMYYYLRAAESPALEGRSLEEYAKSPLVENNWMTRFLSNHLGGELTQVHEARAKEVLRRKCLVGLLSQKAQSLERFEKYFGWKYVGEKMEYCQDQLLNWDWSNKNKHPRIKEGGVVWRSLEENNTFDIRLHEYARQLFLKQAALFV